MKNATHPASLQKQKLSTFCLLLEEKLFIVRNGLKEIIQEKNVQREREKKDGVPCLLSLALIPPNAKQNKDAKH